MKILGELAMVLVFALLGRLSHHLPLTPLATVQTALPFLLGWLVALRLGCLVEQVRPARSTNQPERQTLAGVLWLTLLHTSLAVACAVPIRALLLGRWSPLFFYVIAWANLLVLMLAWRLLWRWLVRRRSRT